MISMRKHYALFAIPLLLAVLLPVPPRDGSIYNGISGAMFCNSAGACLHEIAHMIDDEAGYPSRSPEFGGALMVHLAFAFGYQMDDTAKLILAQDGVLTYNADYSLGGVEMWSSPQAELYANIYEMHGGDVAKIPDALRPFYSDNEKYTDLYNCLMQADFRICGRAVHIEE